MSQKNQKQTLDVNDAISQSEAFVNKHKKSIIIGLAAIIVVIAACFGIYYWQKAREDKAQTLLSLGQTYFMQGDYEKALKGDGKTFPGYVKIASSYSFTDAANIAHLYAGISYAKTNKIKEAISELEKFSTKGDVTISPAALGTLANCYAANNQLDKAIDTFKDAAKLADNASFSPIFLMEAGRLLELQGKKEEAHKLYVQVKESYPTSMQASPIQQNGMMASPEIDKYIERTK